MTQLQVNTESQFAKKLSIYLKKAIREYNLIQPQDRILVCVSGGKDSLTLACLLHELSQSQEYDFEVHAYTLDQSQPGWNDHNLREWYEVQGISYTIEKKDTFSVVTEKIPQGKTMCSLCSRLRRGNIYRFAKEQGFSKIALGHHRDDLIQTLLMSIFYNGKIKSMPPKLRTDDGAHLVIRPLVFCQEKDIAQFAKINQFPIIPCNLCGSQENLARVKVKQLIAALAAENPKIPSNMLHALQDIQPSQLMDQRLWDFNDLQIDALPSEAFVEAQQFDSDD